MMKRLKGRIIIAVIMLCVFLTACSKSENTVDEGDVQFVKSSTWVSIRDNSQHHTDSYTLGETALKIKNELSSTLELNHIFIDDIPLYEMHNKDVPNEKIIIFLHGQYSRKEEFLFDMIRFAEEGYYCVTLDLVGHGERIKSYAIMSLEIAKLTANDIDVVLDYYRSCGIANADEIALIGFSQGGSVAYMYCAYGETVPKAIVIGSSTPDYSFFADDTSIKDGKIYETLWSEDEISDFIKNNNPVNNLQRFYSISILSGNNINDPKITYKGSESLEQKLRGVNNDIHFYYYDISGHDVPETFVQKMLPFIKERL